VLNRIENTDFFPATSVYRTEHTHTLTRHSWIHDTDCWIV